MKKKLIGMAVALIFSLIVLLLVIGSEYKSIGLLWVADSIDCMESATKAPVLEDDFKPSKTTQTNEIHVTVRETVKPDEIIETKMPEEANPSKSPNENDKKEIQLSFVGDILLSDGVLNNYKGKGMEGILSKEILTVLKKADIAIANEEFPFSQRGEKAPDKQYTFRVNPQYAKLFNKIGIDVVTLANNHALDFGIDSLLDTFDTLDSAQITYIGAGKDIDRAKEIQYKTINDVKIAFVAASRVIPVTDWNATKERPGLLTTYDPTILLEQIVEAEKQAEYTVVYVHWGIERKERPEEYQRNLAKQYIDAGADLVIGSHPHCLQGIEFYNGKPIVYSLGNFVFGTTISRTAVLNVKIDSNLQSTLSILPCKANNFFTEEIINNNHKEQFNRYLESISYDILIEQNGVVKEVH